MPRIAAQVRTSYPANSTPRGQADDQQDHGAGSVADPGVRRRAELGAGPLAQRRVDRGRHAADQRQHVGQDGLAGNADVGAGRPGRAGHRQADADPSGRRTGAGPARRRSGPATPAGWRPARSRWPPSRAARSASRWRSARPAPRRPARRRAGRDGAGYRAARRGAGRASPGSARPSPRALRQKAMARAGAAAKAISGADDDTARTATVSAAALSKAGRWRFERIFIPRRRFLHICAPQFVDLG